MTRSQLSWGFVVALLFRCVACRKLFVGRLCSAVSVVRAWSFVDDRLQCVHEPPAITARFCRPSDVARTLYTPLCVPVLYRLVAVEVAACAAAAAAAAAGPTLCSLSWFVLTSLLASIQRLHDSMTVVHRRQRRRAAAKNTDWIIHSVCTRGHIYEVRRLWRKKRHNVHVCVRVVRQLSIIHLTKPARRYYLVCIL